MLHPSTKHTLKTETLITVFALQSTSSQTIACTLLSLKSTGADWTREVVISTRSLKWLIAQHDNWGQPPALKQSDCLTCSICLTQVISPTQMAKGFQRVLDSVADLRLDVPEAPQQIAAFIARAVADDILPPEFAENIPAGKL